jgi:Predicted membrane protein
VPVASAARVGPDDAALGIELADGRRLGRCLRCDAWLVVPPPARAAFDVVPPLSELDLPRRGEPLREAIVLRLIAIERAAHSVAFGLLAIVLVLLDTRLEALHSSAQRVRDQLDSVAAQSGRAGSRTFLDSGVQRILGLHGKTITVLAVTATVYAVVEGIEAVGLWRERRWAEYLTAIATAGFLPFEVHEMVARFTVVRVGAFVVNVALLVFLVWSKRLFGLRGGRAALQKPFDWRSTLADPEPPRLDPVDLVAAVREATVDGKARP